MTTYDELDEMDGAVTGALGHLGDMERAEDEFEEELGALLPNQRRLAPQIRNLAFKRIAPARSRAQQALRAAKNRTQVARAGDFSDKEKGGKIHLPDYALHLRLRIRPAVTLRQSIDLAGGTDKNYIIAMQRGVGENGQGYAPLTQRESSFEGNPADLPAGWLFRWRGIEASFEAENGGENDRADLRVLGDIQPKFAIETPRGVEAVWLPRLRRCPSSVNLTGRGPSNVYSDVQFTGPAYYPPKPIGYFRGGIKEKRELRFYFSQTGYTPTQGYEVLIELRGDLWMPTSSHD